MPDYFERGPCRGKQFVDVDSFSYKFKLNQPHCNSCLIEALKGIAFVIGFIIGAIELPIIGISVSLYYLIFDEEIITDT